MIALSVNNLTKFYGGRRILHQLDLAVDEHARLGLVGPNGAGKSTLLRIVAGQEEINAGEVVRRKGLRIAFLPQHVPPGQGTALDVLRAARPDLAEIEAQLTACEVELGDPEVAANLVLIERVLARQEQLLASFESLGGPGAEGEARSHLRMLGLTDEDMALPLAALSGGQRKLVALAACLVARPDLLLLDEPETHLDLTHREHLEQLIREFAGAALIVSHDRYLLDETVTEIAELEGERIRLWPGNYSAYTLAREVALLRQQQLFVTQQQEIARLEEAIARFKLWASWVPDPRHIKQARNKQRQIDAMEKVDKPVLQRRTMALRLHAAERGGQKVIELRDVNMAFGDDIVLLGTDLEVRRGERVGIVGENGAGKSVLAKLLTGELEPIGGTRWIGPSIALGYFAQGHETLDLDATPLSLVRQARAYTEPQAIAALGKFLFRYEQARQQIRTLSGGERSRLQLLLLMFGTANCLVLDEPTNHLDIDSAEVLEAALEGYEGTVIVVSHDRYFLDRIADRIVEVRDGEVRSFAGGYTAWMEAKKPKPAPAPAPEKPAKSPERPLQQPQRLITQKRF